MAKLIKFFELNTGAKIPSVGLGTWQAEPGVVAKAVTIAIQVKPTFFYIFLFQFFFYLSHFLNRVLIHSKKISISPLVLVFLMI